MSKIVMQFPSMGSLQADLPNSNTTPLAAHGFGPRVFNTHWTPSLALAPYQPAAPSRLSPCQLFLLSNIQICS